MSWWKGLFSSKKKSNNQFYSAKEINKIILESNFDDPLYPEAVVFVISTKSVSISSIQRQFKIVYNRAARIVESLELNQIVSEPSLNGARKVLTDQERSNRTRKILTDQERSKVHLSALYSAEAEKQKKQNKRKRNNNLT